MRIARFVHPASPNAASGVSWGAVEGPAGAARDALTVAAIAGHPFESITFTGDRWSLSDVRLLAPILPSKVVAVGRNYADHVREMGHDEPPEAPMIFLKPSTSVIGDGDYIRLPPDTNEVHHEAELAAVIGRPARDVSAEEALSYVLGYAAANDVSARDQQRADVQWARAKGHDSFCPLGPWIETVLDPSDLQITAHVNGQLRQDSRTSLMLHPLPELIAYMSAVMTLLPGDVILTGTPAGVGPIVAGDTVSIEIEGIGVLSNPVQGQVSGVASPVRVRFCPSPTGNPHVGLIRTCLFNWAYARHVGGAFVFRVEDTDAARDSEDSYDALLSALRWLGLEWDEGPEVGGPHAPYRQSERGEIYADAIARLQAAGHLYESFTTAAETEARHKEAGRDPKLGYDNFDRTLTDAQRAAFVAEGRAPVLRLRMPDEDLSWHDLVRGEVVFRAGTVSDFVVARAGGQPLYTLVNPLDDALMRITHVLRGEDLLPSTPRQIALYRALIDIGITDFTPQFGHLPYVMGEGNRKLSKRDPQAALNTYRVEGYVPEGLLNYLALLGWSIADDRDVFSLDEMVAAFDVADVNANPARFDPKKCLAINATHIRLLKPDDFARRLVTQFSIAGVAADPGLVTAAAPIVQERIKTLAEGVDLLRFLFVAEPSFVVDADDAAKHLGADGQSVLAAALSSLSALPNWRADEIEWVLSAILIDGLGLKPREAYTPIRVAVSGSVKSPPLFESLELLGRERTLGRIQAGLATS